MPRKPIRDLFKQLEEARDQKLIADLANYSTCEINTYMVILFNTTTSDQTKDILMKHIVDTYDDILCLHFSTLRTRLFIEYDDWETIPKRVAL